jgi:ATP-dependent DNA helicase Rep
VITHKIAADRERPGAAAHRRHHLHQQGRRRNARARRRLIGRQAKDVLICTFHALGVRMVREDGHALGLKPQFSILDADDVTGILKDCAGGTTDVATARQWQWTISGWKNQGWTAARPWPGPGRPRAQHRPDHAALRRAPDRLPERGLRRPDRHAHALLRGHPEVREKWQRMLGHVLVDEYQDTNATQYELLKLLVGERAHFTAVGDDDQSIYGWRGATLDNLKKLPVDYPQLKVIKLEQNYRSTSAILRAANNVIGPNPKLFPKTLFSELGEGEPVRVVDCDTESTRPSAPWPASRACAPQPAAGVEGLRHPLPRQPPGQAVREGAAQGQHPYKVSGGTSFFDRAEIKDLCAWFRLWINNDDDPAFLRAITTPKRGIGHTTLGKLGEFSGSTSSHVRRAVQPMLEAVLPKAHESLLEFGRYINDLEYRARHTLGAEAARLLIDWLKEIGYEQHLYDSEDSESVAAARWSNVLEFCDWMAQRAAARSRCGRHHHPDRGQEPAGGGAEHCPALHHQRAREGAGHGGCPPCTPPRAWNGRM